MARSSSKATRRPQTFEFAYQQKRYVIKERYQGRPVTLITTDGLILKVTQWQLGVPFEPVLDEGTPETFDPQTQQAADLAAQLGGLVAELVVQPEEAK